MKLGIKIGIGVGALGAIGGLTLLLVNKNKAKAVDISKPLVAPPEPPNFNFTVEKIEKADPKPKLDDLVKDLGYKTGNQAKDEEDDIPFSKNDHVQKFKAIDTTDPEWEGGDAITLHYYEDGVMTSDDKPPHILTREEVQDIVGDFKQHIGEYEQDYCVIFNRETKTQYEIMKEEGTFREALARNPRWSGDDA